MVQSENTGGPLRARVSLSSNYQAGAALTQGDDMKRLSILFLGLALTLGLALAQDTGGETGGSMTGGMSETGGS